MTHPQVLVEMVANFVSTIAAFILMSAFTITPAAIWVAPIVPVMSPLRLPVNVAAVPVQLPVTFPITFPYSSFNAMLPTPSRRQMVYGGQRYHHLDH